MRGTQKGMRSRRKSVRSHVCVTGAAVRAAAGPPGLPTLGPGGSTTGGPSGSEAVECAGDADNAPANDVADGDGVVAVARSAWATGAGPMDDGMAAGGAVATTAADGGADAARAAAGTAVGPAPAPVPPPASSDAVRADTYPVPPVAGCALNCGPAATTALDDDAEPGTSSAGGVDAASAVGAAKDAAEDDDGGADEDADGSDMAASSAGADDADAAEEANAEADGAEEDGAEEDGADAAEDGTDAAEGTAAAAAAAAPAERAVAAMLGMSSMAAISARRVALRKARSARDRQSEKDRGRELMQPKKEKKKERKRTTYRSAAERHAHDGVWPAQLSADLCSIADASRRAACAMDGVGTRSGVSRDLHRGRGRARRLVGPHCGGGRVAPARRGAHRDDAHARPTCAMTPVGIRSKH